MEWNSIYPWIMFAGGASCALATYLFFPAFRKEIVIAVAIGICSVLLGIAVRETSLTIDPVAGIVGSAFAAFLGAYYAFDLQRDSAKSDEVRRLRIAALEEIQALWGQSGPYSDRLLATFIHHEIEGNRIVLLLRRVSDDSLLRLYQEMINTRDRVSERMFLSNSERKDLLRTLENPFYETQMKFLNRIEGRLLTLYGIEDNP